MILDPGFNLTLRPMQYPVFYEMYQAAIKNTWTVDEVDFATDIMDLRSRAATKIQKTTVTAPEVTDADAVACSLENPGACEACQ